METVKLMNFLETVSNFFRNFGKTENKTDVTGQVTARPDGPTRHTLLELVLVAAQPAAGVRERILRED